MLALVMAAAAALPAQWNEWKYERAIQLNGRTGTVSVVVPPSLYGNAQPSLDDVRIVSGGTSVPFTIATPPSPPDVRWIDARLQDTGYVPGRYAQAVADLGSYATPVETLEIVTPQESFAVKADVDTSDDARVWRTIKTAAPIYDYAQDGLATNLRIGIPPTTSRYIRVRIASASPFAIDGIRAAKGSNAPRALERYAVAASLRGDAKGVATYDLSGIVDVPIERIDVTASTREYARRVNLQNASSGGPWQDVQSATLERSAQRSNAAIRFDETQAQRWRLAVNDGDNAPLTGMIVYAYGAPRSIVFDASAGSRYVLLYGNPSARAAAYDYAQTHARALHVAPAVALAAPSVNPWFVPEAARRPWSERNRWLLWGALAAVALAIALTALRALRNGAAPESSP